MLEKVLTAIAIGIIRYLDGRTPSTAKDADSDTDTLRRGGDRIREWMRHQDDIRSRGQSDAGGTVRTIDGVPPR